MKVELDLDIADEIAVQSMLNSHAAMVQYLEDYKDLGHKWIAIFDPDKEKDIEALKKMRDALALVITEWYGGSVK